MASDEYYSLIDKGNYLYSRGFYKESLEWFNKALNIKPDDTVALGGKGNSLRMLGRYEESLEWLDRALEINPNEVFALSGKGASLRMLGRYEESLKWLDRALEISPDHEFALWNKGESLRQLGRYEESLKCYDKALEINPNGVFALSGKGASLRMLGRYEESLKWLDRALETSPNYEFALASKGASLHQLGRYGESLKCYDKALEISPDYKFALWNKDESLRVLSRYEEAEVEKKKINIEQKDISTERPRITAAYPQVIPPRKWRTIEVFIYLKKMKALVDREIDKLKDHDDIEYEESSSQFLRALPEGCPIRITLSSEILRSNPSEISILWLEPYNRLQFRVCTFEEISNITMAPIDIDVFANDLLVASLRLPIIIDTNVLEPKNVNSDAQWYEKIFASYARENLRIAKHLKERYAALGLSMFIDLDDLRSGDMWLPKLFSEIETSDLFQLLWSKAASKSDNVKREWKHAVEISETKGHKFIRPIYWEVPMPEIPEELKDINFRYIPFAKQSGSDEELKIV